MSARALISASQIPTPYEALFINHANMEPDVQRGSIAFVDPPGYTGEGIYSVPYYDGRHLGDLRRIFWWGEGYRLKIDNWPQDAPFTVLSKTQLIELAPRRVAGIARPFTNDFADFLRRFANEK